jgi:uncharacterized protein (DUF362 family)/Pyruvate/2-oxoacid:ferredoxin oxidoreductase delta subunit
MKTLVAVTRTNYGVEKAVKLAIELLGGVDNFISPGETVLLKPNLFNVEPPETGCTTDMRIVLATAELLKKQGSKCILGECPATAAYTRPEMIYEAHNLYEICKKADIELKVLDRDHPVKRTTNGKVLDSFYFPETAVDNPIINLPKLKTHALTTLSCAVKNLFGLQQGGIKAHHHVSVSNDPEAFSHLLLDLYQAIKAQIRLNIVDAHIAMEGEGPAAGVPVPLGLIIAGENPIAVDLVSSAIIGWNPQKEVGTNYLAKIREIGPRSLDEIEIIGEQIETVRRFLKKPQIHQDGEMFIKIRMPIHCDTDKCRGCGVCEKICPANAIKVLDLPEFNMEKCIQCFCCVELCPYNALKAQRPDE